MEVEIKSLDTELEEFSKGIFFVMYTQGNCYDLAVALHRELEYSLLGIKDETGHICHAGVRLPSGDLFDIRGPQEDPDVFMEPFRGPNSKLEIVSITEKDLFDITHIHDESIEIASRRAQMLWPELPWKKGCFRDRVYTFLKELGDLCEKHSLIIRAPFPAQQPVVSDFYGDEKLVMTPSFDGGSYFFDRKIGH